MARKRPSSNRSGRRSTTQRRRPAPARSTRSQGPTNRRKGSRKRKSRFSLKDALIWFGAGLGLGLLVLLPFFLFSGEEEPPEEPPAPAESAPEPAADPEREKATAPSGSPEDEDPAPREEPAPEAKADSPPKEEETEPGYRFYTLLPNMEVEVPEPPAEKAPEPAPEPTREPEKAESGAGGETSPEPAPRPDGGGEFLLQVASFQQPDSAEALKAELALQGLQAKVVDSDLGDKGTWYRVRLGPYAERAEAETVRDRLEEKGLRPMVMRR
jgi:cell division protein FtsN